MSPGEERLGVDTDECGGGWGRGVGTDLGSPSQMNPGGGMAGVSWHCGGGHMEGRLALWLPPERAPADGWGWGWGICQENQREEEGLFVQGGILFPRALLKTEAFDEDCLHQTRGEAV